MDEIEIPPLMCWWCEKAIPPRVIYQDVPEPLDLHLVKFNGVTHEFPDGESRYVCRNCISLFYMWSQKAQAESAYLR